MERRIRIVAAAALLLTALLVPTVADAGRVSCTEVIREIDEVIGRRGTYRPDPMRIARRLGTDPEWVVRCANIYGRRLSKSPERLIDVERDQQDERWESDEPMEVGREEMPGEEGDGPILPEERDRRPPRLVPTPSIEQEMNEGFQ